MNFVAALPMYDLPEERAAVDAAWHQLRDALRQRGIPAPQDLARRNADLPAVPGGIRDASGTLIAPDPATLPPETFDLHVLWRHPALLLGETCWGPLDRGLKPFVHVVAQNSYDGLTGGDGPLYRSAIVERRHAGDAADISPAHAAAPILPPLAGRRFAFNAADSRSGYLSLVRDLAARGASMALFSRTIQTGSHLSSLHRVAQGAADLAAIDCRSWALAQRHHPSLAAGLRVTGWTSPSTGLPFICSASLPEDVRRTVMQAARCWQPASR
ncbi:PhnD/SsuA/transferrin family substrate-binding protein [Gluconacetobacter sp. 1b LMG 1731]|uniref:PhnD/SsuA/transferrin family substrate-binding protein n=1 Tax=Gluconacetobacter dulcium TaxID=2729096 RepID=A0A7W4NUB9_9PROT|nr:PhnD/SsuA/transferrin family substrate-binding protein [Gluconacetobacter dulcium]MBB2166437.1 PhnD/SsuA/transferrin family substrate-binding protein [Gluconacetobacter dulcium]MBB2195555.1 PhnD/SsuA/transferrin family substrate-binding protein [Gluconacetobacter dulcium]